MALTNSTPSLVLAAICWSPALTMADQQPSSAPPTTPPAAVASPSPPYPERLDPFKMPSDKAVLATRREAAAVNLNLKLKGFVKVGELKAVVLLDDNVVLLGVGERRGEIQVLEIAPPNLTLQRGRHRWTETMEEERPTAALGGK